MEERAVRTSKRPCSDSRATLRRKSINRWSGLRFAISRGASLFFISDGTNFQFAFFNLQSAMLMDSPLSLLITPPPLTQSRCIGTPPLPEQIELHRDRVWRRDEDLRVESAVDAERFIEDVG